MAACVDVQAAGQNAVTEPLALLAAVGLILLLKLSAAKVAYPVLSHKLVFIFNNNAYCFFTQMRKKNNKQMVRELNGVE
jgi:hypothetical protein